ncbi:MAG: protein translocase subunit SecF [Actinomycetota bacterium]|nr:protein translocase subunit SecF [Actinomycetota bacterium]|tara:strand:+ start:422 stop:1477 length:1056 start_codon:yes stop_codon:yes gene_type:complete
MSFSIKRMYQGNTSWDFLGVSRRVLVCSAVAVIICVAALLVRGLNLGIEFEGGGVWESPASEVITTDTIDNAMSNVGMDDARIQRITGGDDIFRVRGELPSGETAESIGSALAQAAQVDPESVSARTVSPSFGDQVAGKARRALVVFFILIALYLTLRFEWKMALGALLAVAHDIVLTVGIYALFQFEISPATVVAFLTIMGYSLYDTIVVFDRVKDNERSLSLKARMTYSDLANVSLNQVIMRSINTTITSVLPVVSLLVVGSLFMGATSLQEFAIALLIGLLVGSYSSLFVAMPTVAKLKQREPHWAEQDRSAEVLSASNSIESAAVTLAADRYDRSSPPRPRKKGRKR